MIRLRKKHSIFWTPPKAVLHCVVIMEIKSGCLFEYDNLFVEYTIDLPYGYKSKSQLNGKTQVSSVKGSEKLAHFGHSFELNINYYTYTEHGTGYFYEKSFIRLTKRNSNTFFLIESIIFSTELSLNTPRAYFEIISSDSWGRRRTEGYCHMSVPISHPGYHQTSLKCVRPLGIDKRTQNMKRFFTGGRHILKDIARLYKPSTFQVCNL